MRDGLIFHDMEQGTPEWYAARMGRVTGSTCAPLLVDGMTDEGKKKAANVKRKLTNAKNRKEPSRGEIAELEIKLFNIQKKHFDFGDGAWSLIYQLAGELITGETATDWNGNYWTDRGKELEAEAAEAYMASTFYQVNRVGFISMGDYAGCSPDHMVDERRGGEYKCLSAREHIRYAHTRQIDKDHLAQVQWNLFITGFEVWDLIHFHPKAGRCSLIIDEILPDENMHAIFDERLRLVSEKISEIVEMAGATIQTSI